MFVKLKSAIRDEYVYVNVDNIVAVGLEPVYGNEERWTHVYVGNKYFYSVKESPEEVMELIKAVQNGKVG